MKKSLIALAVASTFAAPAFAATSNVDIYGIIDGSVTMADVKIDGSQVLDNWQVGSPGGIDASRIGFKGSEDLGGGLKAIWQIETQFSLDSTSDSNRELGNRNTFVGLSGGFGTVLIGNHDTPEKISTGRLDFFADSVGDYNASMTILDTRERNVLAYISPSFSGFTGAIATVAGEQATGPNDGIADHFSMAGMYENGPLYLSAAYTSLSDGYSLSAQKFLGQTFFGSTTLGDTDIFRLGIGYTMGDFKVGAVYQNIDIDGFGEAEDGYSLGGSYTMGPMVLKAQYMAREDVLEGYAIGVDYNMSKRTKAYVVYTDMENDGTSVIDTVDAQVLSIGLRHSF